MPTFPSGIEVFADAASCVAAAGSGGTNGTGSPSAGTTEFWTVSTGSTSFPVANHTAVPATYFYVRDPADTTNEIVLVTDNNSSGSPGTAWSVTRGMNGATVAHASGATWVQVIAPYTLQNFKQAVGAATSAVTVSNTTTETVVATYTPATSAEIAAGTTYEIVAFGTYTNAAATTRTMAWRLRWGGVTGTVLCEILTGTNAPALATTAVAGSSFDVNGSVTLLSATTATANLNLFYTNSTNSLTAAQSTATATNATTGGASSSTAVTISGSGPLVLTLQWGQNTLLSATATAPLIFREA